MPLLLFVPNHPEQKSFVEVQERGGSVLYLQRQF